MNLFTKQKIEMFLSGVLLTPCGAFLLYAGFGFFDGSKYMLLIFMGVLMVLMGIGSFYIAFVGIKQEEKSYNEHVRELMARDELMRSISERMKLEKELAQRPESKQSVTMLRKLFDDDILTGEEYLKKLKELKDDPNKFS